MSIRSQKSVVYQVTWWWGDRCNVRKTCSVTRGNLALWIFWKLLHLFFFLKKKVCVCVYVYVCVFSVLTLQSFSFSPYESFPFSLNVPAAKFPPTLNKIRLHSHWTVFRSLGNQWVEIFECEKKNWGQIQLVVFTTLPDALYAKVSHIPSSVDLGLCPQNRAWINVSQWPRNLVWFTKF